MSFSALNSPPLLSVLTVGCYALLPVVQDTFRDKTIPWVVVKSTNVLVYAFSVWCVSQPGRYDSYAAIAEDNQTGKEETSQEENTSAGATGMRKMGTGRQGRTLLPPAGWAFVIWGPIFLGELLMVSSQTTLAEGHALEETIRRITGPYVLAQAFQSLWTASFRPKYNEGFYKYVSALNLAGIALSLSFCHQAFVTSKVSFSNLEYGMYFLPLALHFGWTTAASLVNVNGMFAMDDQVSARSVAWLGHASVAAATALGVAITLARTAPVYGGVIAWALSAVASGLSRRLRETEKEDPARVGVYGAKTQLLLSQAGAACCALTTLYVTLSSSTRQGGLPQAL